jgi:hypothetical protein
VRKSPSTVEEGMLRQAMTEVVGDARHSTTPRWCRQVKASQAFTPCLSKEENFLGASFAYVAIEKISYLSRVQQFRLSIL